MIAVTRRDVLIGMSAAVATGDRSRADAVQDAVPGGASSDWTYASLKTLAEALRARRISALELTDRVIERIERLDRRINAVVVRDFERARDAARAADTALSRGEAGALLGIPISVKESFNVAGLPTTWGDPRFRHFMPKEDALVVSRVKKAGAVIFGKTNVPRWLSDWQSYNDLYGTTRNPWNLRLTPGGSSGGSAAALAAGFGSLSLGSDIGASLRAPAHYCGVCAHTPSWGLVPRRGQAPPGTEPLPREIDLAVVGPMARSAADLRLALDVIAGPDEEASGTAYRLVFPPPRHDRLHSYRVLIIDQHPLGPTSNAVRMALERLSDRLARAGARVAHSSPVLPDLARSARLYMRLLSAYWGAGLPPAAYDRLLGAADVLSPRDRSLAAERARGAVLSHRDWLDADLSRAELRQRWRELFREWDVVLCPATPTPAFPHDHSLPIEARRLRVDGKLWPYIDAQLVWATVATTPGLPATVVPTGPANSGLPIGVQIIGPSLEDATTLGFAELLEREFGGFAPPPGYA